MFPGQTHVTYNQANAGYPAPQMAQSQQYPNGYANSAASYQQQKPQQQQGINQQGYIQPTNILRPPQQMLDVQGLNYPFQYSQCNGTRKALLIGINYIGSKNQLQGCINDSHNIYNILTSKYNYRPEDIVELNDDQQEYIRIPTRENMIRAMQWLVKDAQPNDSLFFHYSGHGGQVPDQDGDEEDGMDDGVYPVDFQTADPLIDDEIHDIMVRPLQPGVRLTALFDSCHSGTVLDLPYTYSTKGVIKEPNMWKEIGQDGMQAALSYALGNTTSLLKSLKDIGISMRYGSGLNSSARERVIQIKSSPADVIMFSGSKDNQTSADTVENSRATGAMSYVFIKVLCNQPRQSYLSMLQNMRNELSGKYSQNPQLSSSHPVDVNLQFLL